MGVCANNEGKIYEKEIFSSLCIVFVIIDFYVYFQYFISPVRLLKTQRTKAKVSLLLPLQTQVSKN